MPEAAWYRQERSSSAPSTAGGRPLELATGTAHDDHGQLRPLSARCRIFRRTQRQFYVEDPQETYLHRLVFNTLLEATLDADASRDLILQTAESYWRHPS
jgi:hypothetical protein